MNIYTVSKATQVHEQYLNNHFKNPSVVIVYDSRNMYKEFEKDTALTFAANNIKVYLFEDLRPTPMISFTVRELNCQRGVVITASHNPKQYNGYNIYGQDSGQITDETENEVIGYINNLDIFKDIKTTSEEEAVSKGLLKYILEDNFGFVVRPSGTEAKMKIYLSVVGESLKDSEEKLSNFKSSVMNKINSILG